jgi:hypothetical protein
MIQENHDTAHQGTCSAFRDVHADPVRLDNAMVHAIHSRPESSMPLPSLPSHAGPASRRDKRCAA